MIDPVFVVELFAPIVERVSQKLTPSLQRIQPLIEGVWYDHGHPINIMQNLKDKDEVEAFLGKRYPLICLFQDLTETMGNKIGVYAEVNLNFAIVMSSTAEYKPDERYRVNYKPILQPIYETFIQEIKDSGNFLYPGTMPVHDKIDRLYYGTQRSVVKDGGNQKNAMWDILDGIEVLNLQLGIYDKCRCATPQGTFLKSI